MKYIIAFITCLFLIGCNDTVLDSSKSTLVENKTITIEDIKKHLEDIPTSLTVENAVELGYFVVDDGKLISEKAIVDDFVNHVTSYITFVYFTDRGDPIVTKVFYDEKHYIGITDATRDNQGEQIYREFDYTYLKVFEEPYQVAYHLTNDPDLTFEILMKSFTSSLSTDHIDQELLIYYEVKDE